jgi:hypothetical protein
MDIDTKKLAEYLWQRGLVDVKNIEKTELVIRQFLKDQKQSRAENL